MFTREQLQEDVRFLAERQKHAGSFGFDRNRSTGISSNSLVSYAYGVGTPQMPSDWSDYAACLRAYRMLPRHRQTEDVALALSVQRSVVAAKYPVEDRRVWSTKRRQTAAA